MRAISILIKFVFISLLSLAFLPYAYAAKNTQIKSKVVKFKPALKNKKNKKVAATSKKAVVKKRAVSSIKRPLISKAEKERQRKKLAKWQVEKAKKADLAKKRAEANKKQISFTPNSTAESELNKEFERSQKVATRALSNETESIDKTAQTEDWDWTASDEDSVTDNEDFDSSDLADSESYE